MLSWRTREATGQLPGKSSATPAQLEPKRNRHDVKRPHGCLPVREPTAQHQRRRAGEMLSTRSEWPRSSWPPRIMPPPRHNGDREPTNTLSTRQKDINTISSRDTQAGSRCRKASASAGSERPVCKQSMTEQLDLRKPHGCGRQGNAARQQRR